LCAPRQVEFRSRLVESGSAGAPREYGARLLGRPSLGYLSWPRKKGDQPPGCPRQIFMHDKIKGKKNPAGLARRGIFF